MNIYLISQTQRTGYDTYDACVVAAKDENAAKHIMPSEHHKFDKSDFSAWTSGPEHVEVELLGIAKEGLILASFNAG